MKINYVIATWSGERIVPEKCDMKIYNNLLNIHLKQLISLNENINQITIMKPLNLDKNNYYNISVIDDRIKIMECKMNINHMDNGLIVVNYIYMNLIILFLLKMIIYHMLIILMIN